MIEEELRSRRERIDQALERFLPAEDISPERLHAAMRYAVLGGGKRLRPACVLIGCSAVGGDEQHALPAACAVELIHTYSLVHDDLPCMDDDDLRRGRATLHRQFDEATAVLAGDALLTLAFEIVAGELPAPTAARVAVALARASGPAGMVGGQVADLEAEGRELDAEAILSIDRRKTAALFAASFRMGAVCGGADPDVEELVGRVGEKIGIAFQIVDDLLDIRSTPEQLGKATGKDRERGKATLPDLLGAEQAYEMARALTTEAGQLAGELPASRLIDELIRSMLQRSR